MSVLMFAEGPDPLTIGLVVLGVITAVAYSSRTNVQPITFPTPVKLQVGQRAPEFTTPRGTLSV